MKGREIINNAVRAKMPDRERVRENCLLQGVQEKQKTKRPFLRRSAFTATAAVLLVTCIVLGNMLTNPAAGNLFTLKAYAAELQPDGSVELHEADPANQTYKWSAYSDGVNFFLNVSLKCEGENISSVDFFTDDGFFAKQYLKTENGKIVAEDGVTVMYLNNGEGDYVTMYGTDFDIIGDSFTLGKNAATDDFLLFLGTEISDWRQRPSKMTVRAVVTFDDGKTQEKTLTFNLSAGEGLGIREIPPEEIERQQAEYEKSQKLLYSIPLEQCSVVPDSVQNLAYGDTFEYSVNDFSTGYFPVTQESIDMAAEQGLFDENGIFRVSSKLYDSWDEYDGSDGFIAVIEKNGDGAFTGKVYRVPGRLILDGMK